MVVASRLDVMCGEQGTRVGSRCGWVLSKRIRRVQQQVPVRAHVESDPPPGGIPLLTTRRGGQGSLSRFSAGPKSKNQRSIMLAVPVRPPVTRETLSAPGSAQSVSPRRRHHSSMPCAATQKRCPTRRSWGPTPRRWAPQVVGV